MKQVKFTLTTIVLFCTLFLVSSFQSRDNFNAEEIKYNFIYFENMTNESGVIYVFEYLNYYSKLGEYHNSGNRSGYIRLAHSSEDAYEFMLTMLRVAAGQGWDVGNFKFACSSYFGFDTVMHYVQGTYSPLDIEVEY